MKRVSVPGNLLFFAGLTAAVIAAYLPSMKGGLLWDDDAHVTRPELRTLEGLRRIWFQPGSTQQYYPAAHTAFWLEHHLWGDATLGYHAANVLEHALAACLLALVLGTLGVPGARLAAALFALHPLSVESVAWISEQKNTLSAVFYMASALAYLRFDNGGRRPAAYAAATAFFLLAVLTKSVTATLPAALLLALGWRHGRVEWRKDVLPLVPWVAAAGAVAVFTGWIEHRMIAENGAEDPLDWAQRLLLPGRIIAFYVGHLFWPAGLTFIYPKWTVSPLEGWQYLFPLGVAGALAVLWRLGRGAAAGALFLIGSLAPALGLFNIYPFRYSYVADHFQYIAGLGVLVPVAAGLTLAGRAWEGAAGAGGAAGAAPERRGRPRSAGSGEGIRLAARWAVRCAAPSLVALLAILTWRQAHVYRGSETLYRATIARNPSCWMARTNLGILLLQTKRAPEALGQFKAALRDNPGFPEGLCDLGNAYQALGHSREAIAEYTLALRNGPRLAIVERDLGNALYTSQRYPEAADHYARSLRLNPADPQAQFNYGSALFKTARFAEAARHYGEALRLGFGGAEVHNDLGLALSAAGNPAAAAAQFKEAVSLDPANAGYHANLGRARSAALFAAPASTGNSGQGGSAPSASPASDAVPYPRPADNWLEAQIVLARNGFSCGPIDGVAGAQSEAALRAFQEQRGLEATGRLDRATISELILKAPPLGSDVLSAADLGRLEPVSPTWLGKSQQTALEYATALELLAERHHASEGLMRRLNPGVDWDHPAAGTAVLAPAVARESPRGAAARILISITDRVLEVFDSGGSVLAHYPVSIARDVSKRPLGELKVIVVIRNPDYTFDPEVFPESAEAREIGHRLILPPGPNNPVGVAWIGLDRPGYGIHGTPEPEHVGRTESHGCFRLANWDALDILEFAYAGLPVVIEP